MEASKARDTFRTGTGAMLDTLGNINPNSTVQSFPTFYVDTPDLSAILLAVVEKTRH